jgi:hypothetical protein
MLKKINNLLVDFQIFLVRKIYGSNPLIEEAIKRAERATKY